MVFETDKEYLEKKKEEYARKGLKIDNEEKIIKERQTNNKIGWFILWFYYTMGITIAFIVALIAYLTECGCA